MNLHFFSTVILGMVLEIAGFVLVALVDWRLFVAFLFWEGAKYCVQGKQALAVMKETVEKIAADK